ncbi:MAG: alpha/beta hydrolase [Candidatus Paceibacterota bacterium]|jgi:pimeloyl-ACP methyl ester carboxylesterase
MVSIEYKQNRAVIDGRELFYKVAGEGKLLLIVHGWGASSMSWMEIVEEMAGKGFKLIIPDLPGFGKSPSPDETWGTENYADIVSKLIKELDLKDFCLLGHSFGGGISLRIATENKNVRKLILCDAAIVREERLDLRQKISKALANIGSRFVSKDFPAYRFFEKFIYKLAGANDYYKASPVMKEVFKKVVSEDLRFLLPKVEQPCFIIWGSEDKATILEDAYFLNKEIKGSELKIIKGGRHNPYKTHPKEVAEAIISFLNK